MRAWIDVENPPQVQYLMPLAEAFPRHGVEPLVSARDYGSTFELLQARGTPFTAVGASYGSGRARKVLGVGRRTTRLWRFARGRSPDALVHAGRAAPLVARGLRIPSFSIWDYEHADMSFDRFARSYILFPDVIDPDAFLSRGIRPDRLVPFRGLKEDLSFAGVDVGAIEPHAFDGVSPELVRVLVRPAAEESHYYREESGDLAERTLAYLASRPECLVVFAPRYPRQVAALDRHAWTNRPVVVDGSVNFVSLLRACDAVVSAGGTMLREAAYLGVPAYSIFRGDVGDVDRHLASIGRLAWIESAADLDAIRLVKRGPTAPLRTNPDLVDDLVGEMTSRTPAHGRSGARSPRSEPRAPSASA